MRKLLARRMFTVGTRGVSLGFLMALAVTFSALAWAVITILSSFAVTTTSQPVDFTFGGDWICTIVSGTGASITDCSLTPSQGFNLSIAGLSEDDLNVTAVRAVRQPGTPGTDKCIGIIGSPAVPPELVLSWVGPNVITGDGEWADSGVRFVSSGIGPNMSLTIPTIEIGMTGVPPCP